MAYNEKRYIGPYFSLRPPCLIQLPISLLAIRKMKQQLDYEGPVQIQRLMHDSNRNMHV